MNLDRSISEAVGSSAPVSAARVLIIMLACSALVAAGVLALFGWPSVVHG